MHSRKSACRTAVQVAAMQQHSYIKTLYACMGESNSNQIFKLIIEMVYRSHAYNIV